MLAKRQVLTRLRSASPVDETNQLNRLQHRITIIRVDVAELGGNKRQSRIIMVFGSCNILVSFGRPTKRKMERGEGEY